MNKDMYLFVLLLSAAVGTFACSKDDDPAPTVVYGTATKANGGVATENGEVNLTTLHKCERNAEDSTLLVSMSNGDNALEFKINGLTSEPKLYQCSQAEDNKDPSDSADKLGGRFNVCRVSVSTVGEAGQNTYKMHRDEAVLKAMDYTGDCSINVKTIGTTVEGTLDCTKLWQTKLDGATRNPLSADATIDVNSTFNCTVTNL
jgi:hypothetical protein